MTRQPLSPIPLEEIRAAAGRIRGSAIRTPLVRANVEAEAEIFLKLENLQPSGAFKIRGAANAIAQVPHERLARGVYTASAGNMALGVAATAKKLGIPCTVIVPDHAPEAKLTALGRLGAKIEKVPFDRWWKAMVDHGAPGHEEVFVHPFSDPAVIAGNATIGLEIFEDLPDVDTVLVPLGGGGLACGVACALRELAPSARVYACEVENAAPAAASLAAGRATEIRYEPSFVDGIGGPSLNDEIWPLVQSMLAGSIVVSVAEVAASVRLLAERNRVVSEGAGASSLAAALSGRAPGKKIACVISGGNINSARLATILQGGAP